MISVYTSPPYYYTDYTLGLGPPPDPQSPICDTQQDTHVRTRSRTFASGAEPFFLFRSLRSGEGVWPGGENIM
ncbi:hypothetical protein XELAEV_18016121mg [Xenopus laevis]|uniref:Uncharacterized protein n=1 Tax=Xenopus laevis TaxID=8355 RepID=A0A974DJH6_XENLA|nr:hypothetical protein XELAEV_18016121mg [Xenopus laevis]